ncbi:S-layer homology domain-containing protein [Peribacillus asahii]|uniref:S-layer homology domain-containing protein n=1 Tax=Peribacillus asahii TaxID=228899 RepID=UPI0020792348|nr:S-layer homology domain-containing protein [Peribacillus asahii]USK59583.1 S-layer homology domain-containing protein [Peribacillus asahii]
MSKKKAIKIATASAIALTGAVAVAQPQADAATNSVDKAITKATTQVNKAFNLYYNTAKKSNKLPSGTAIRKEVKLAEQYYAAAQKEIAAKGGSKTKKAAYTKKLEASKTSLNRVKNYVAAISVTLKASRTALDSAIESGSQSKVLAAQTALDKKIAEFEKAVAKVFGPDARRLLTKTYTTPAKAESAAVATEMKVYVAYKEIESKKLITTDLEKAGEKIESVKADVEKLKAKDSKLAKNILKAVEKNNAKYEAAKVPAVTSVIALNAKELEVTFNQTVDATDAASTSKYKVEGETVTKAEVSEDGKTVTLTTADELKLSNAKVTVSPIKTKADAKVSTAEFNKLITFEDKTPVAVKSVKAEGATAVITFEEPVKSEGAVSLNGVELTSGYTLSGETLTITGLTAEKSYTVDVVGATDFADNIANPISVNFTVAKPEVDSSKPTVNATVNGTEITFDFSEELAAQTLKNGNEYAKVTVGSTTFYLTDAEIKDATDKTKFTLDAKTALGTNSFVNTTVKVEGQKDKAGNAGDAFEFNATLTKDTTPATLASASAKLLVADDTNVTTDKDELYLTFNEPVKVKGDLTLKTKNGIVYTTGNVTAVDESAGTGFDVDGNGKIEGSEKNTVKISIDLDSNSAYAFELAAKAVTDLTGNVNADAIKFNVSTGTFEAAPGKVEANLAFATSTFNSSTVFTVEYTADVTSSATTASNYTLGGKALPAGTQLQFVNGTKQVRITLPAGSITANGSYVLEAKNVVDTKGNTLKDGKASTPVALKENVAPEASKVTVVDSKTFTVDFSEAIADEADVAGLTVKIGGVTVTPKTAVATNGKLTVTTTNDFAQTDSISVEFKLTNLVDKNGNKVTDATVSK